MILFSATTTQPEDVGSRETPLSSSLLLYQLLVILACQLMAGPPRGVILSMLLILPSMLASFPADPLDPRDPAVFMVQMQAARAPRNSTGTPRSRLKPWEVYRFYTCAHHKAGVDLNLFLELNVFSALGLDMSKDFGVWAHFCPPGPPDFCYNPEAKVRIAMDICSWETVQLEREAASPQRVLVAGTVRDPLDMVASAYCYHHAWNEWNNPTFEKPPLKVEFMDVHEGVDFMAKTLGDQMDLKMGVSYPILLQLL